jgi:hypothetical protein
MQWLAYIYTSFARVIFSSCQMKTQSKSANFEGSNQELQLGCPHFNPDHLVTLDYLCPVIKPNMSYLFAFYSSCELFSIEALLGFTLYIHK